MSEIERYLDELFDRLAGQGAAGRRALMEAEDHLRAAATDAMARGLPGDQAEHDAVARFGPPAMVARNMRSAHRAGHHNRALSAGWLLAGLAFAGLGVAYMAAAGRLGWRSPACANILSASCVPIGPAGDAIRSAVIAAAAGAVLLCGRWVAVRYAGLAPASRGFALATGMVFVVAAVVIGGLSQIPVPAVGLLWQAGLLLTPQPFIIGATVLIECLAAAVSLADPRPRGYLH